MQRKSGTPTFARRSTSIGSVNASNRAFVIEALILLAFLAVSVAIVLQLFSAAGVMSREAHKLSVSEHLATNAAETFGANPTGAAGIAYFDKDGNQLESQAGAVYSVETSVSSTTRTAGTMHQAKITVINYELRYDGNVTYELETSRYLPDPQAKAQPATNNANAQNAAQAQGGETGETAPEDNAAEQEAQAEANAGEGGESADAGEAAPEEAAAEPEAQAEGEGADAAEQNPEGAEDQYVEETIVEDELGQGGDAA